MGRLHFYGMCVVLWGAGPRGLFAVYFWKYTANRVALQCGMNYFWHDVQFFFGPTCHFCAYVCVTCGVLTSKLCHMWVVTQIFTHSSSTPRPTFHFCSNHKYFFVMPRAVFNPLTWPHRFTTIILFLCICSSATLQFISQICILKSGHSCVCFVRHHLFSAWRCAPINGSHHQSLCLMAPINWSHNINLFLFDAFILVLLSSLSKLHNGQQ